MADCWTCGAERGREAFCTSCKKIQPVVRNTSLFDVLSLKPVMALDRDALEAAYRELSKRVHPDRFGRESRIERRFALEQTTLANDAYRTLKKPRTRAEYLMKLRGREIGGEDARVDDMEFLEEMIELREALSEAKAASEIAHLHASIEARHDTELARLTKFFDDGDGTEDIAATALEHIRFYERFLDEVDARFDD